MLGVYRVLDLTDEKGFYCGQLLGSLGADVIKVERPGGDPARDLGAFFRNERDPEKNLYWLAFNTNKRGVTLDIRTGAGQEIFRRLVKEADVLVESFPPGYLEGLGLSYAVLEKLNPRLVLTSISPFGQTGPRRDYKSSDIVSWAMGGMLWVTGDPERAPVRVSHLPLSYLLAGMDAAAATAIALYWRGLSGKGQQVDLSIQDSVVKSAWMVHVVWANTGNEWPRNSSFYPVPNSKVTLRLVWPCRDGYVVYLIYVGAYGAAESSRLTKWVDDAGLADDYLRGIDWLHLDWRQSSQEEADRIMGYFARLFASRTKQELFAEALQRDVQLQPLNTPKDIMESPHFEARQYWQEVHHPELGETLKYPARFCLPSLSPTRIWRRAPLAGEHNGEVFGEMLGLSGEELAALKKGGVI